MGKFGPRGASRPPKVDSGGAGGNRESEGDNMAPLGGQGGVVENQGPWGSTDEVGPWIG